MLLIIKKFFALTLAQVLIVMSILTPMSAAAADANAFLGKITTTQDPAGAMSSQARSIYSLGGGSIRFSQKSISLFSANAPSFGAGCNGINWHFGGFSFISEAEIQALIEAISQAAVGVVIDLAMNVLCPQCYAVMNTMRDYANKMRQGLQDSCALAKRLVAPISTAIAANTDFAYTEDASRKSCADWESSGGTANSYAKGVIKMDMCAGVDALAGAAKKGYQALFGPDSKDKDRAQDSTINGNLTFQTLKAMGYPPESYIMSVIMTTLGISIYGNTGETGCANIYSELAKGLERTMATANSNYAEATKEVDSLIARGADQPDSALAGSLERAAQARSKAMVDTLAVAESIDAAEVKIKAAAVTTNYCYLAPMLTDISQLADMLMCGSGPSDAALYEKSMAALFNNTGWYGSNLQGNSQVYRTCAQNAGKEGATPTMGPSTISSSQLRNVNGPALLYKCNETEECLKPTLVSAAEFETAKASSSNAFPDFKGVYWLVSYLLMQGVSEVRCSTTSMNNCGGLDISTKNGRDRPWIKFVASSDYPLYRIINFAAVYPEQSQAIISAYAATIAAQHVIQALNQMMKPGNSAKFELAGKDLKKKTSADEINKLRMEISGQVREAAPYMDKAFKQLSEKKTLIEFIIQLNKSLQQEVTSQGLNGNSNLAVNIKASLPVKKTNTTTPSAGTVVP